MPYAAFLLDAGFDVLAPDARGHGTSGGFATYGIREADDMRRWAAWIAAATPGACVYALGSSMGARARAAGRSRGGRRSARSSATRRSRPSSKPGWIASPGRSASATSAAGWAGPRPTPASATCALRYGVNLLDAAPAAAIGRIHAPLLLIHGDDDRNTPVYHARGAGRGPARGDAVAGAGRGAQRRRGGPSPRSTRGESWPSSAATGKIGAP